MKTEQRKHLNLKTRFGRSVWDTNSKLRNNLYQSSPKLQTASGCFVLKQFCLINTFMNMKLIKALISGFAGAIALNLLHESARKLDHQAPRVDLVGAEALSKGLSALGMNPPSGNKLYAATLAGDVLSNGIYYSAIGFGKPKYLWVRAAISGLSAGVGAVTLPSPMGLDDRAVKRTEKTAILTVTWYLFGALVTAAVMSKLQKKTV
jgi:hypothetical protein